MAQSEYYREWNIGILDVGFIFFGWILPAEFAPCRILVDIEDSRISRELE
jgi:hypothetical protein